MGIKILIPLDTSAFAERVLAHLRWFAPPDTTDLVLVSVIEPAYYTYGSLNYSLPDILETTQSNTNQYLDNLCAALRDEGYAVSKQLFSGDPASVIVGLAKTLNVDMIAMTTHGRSGFVRWALGSVAERVIQNTTVPILLVRDATSVPAHVPGSVPFRIMVPLDGSKLSELALKKAKEVARQMNAKILLFTAFDVPVGDTLSLYTESLVSMEEMVDRWRKDTGTYLSEVAHRLRADGFNVETEMMLGEVAQVIEEVTVREKIDLIVMSTHGRSGLSRWVYGSVANKVLRTVDCPLLLVRATGVVEAKPSTDSEPVSIA